MKKFFILMLLVSVTFSGFSFSLFSKNKEKEIKVKKEVVSKQEVKSSGEVINLTDKNFKDFVQDKTVVVDFYANWCGPCVSFAPIFENVAKDNPSIIFIKVNVDKAPITSNKYGVQYIPFIVIMKAGKIEAQFDSNDRSKANFQNWVLSNIK